MQISCNRKNNDLYLLRKCMKIGEDHFLRLLQSSDWGIQICLPEVPKIVQILSLLFVAWIVHLAAEDLRVDDK